MTSTIVRAAIHPGLGIARMGNSTEYFLAPQVMTPEPRSQGSYHDADGSLKREGVEFRIYGYDAQGNVVSELTADTADIEWTVEVAAMKAHWYKFRAAMDLPAAKDFSLERRNPDYDEAKRCDLAIQPGPHAISGSNAESGLIGANFVYNTTTTRANISELRTDNDGRLIVLSGFGKSGSPVGLPVYVKTEEDAFGNATGWYDEAADGPVTATVTIEGVDVPCEGAWVAITPPNFAPEIIGWRTMLDMLEDLWSEGASSTPTADKVSFTKDIHPILERLSGLQWVNQGYVAFFGPGGPLDFSDTALIDKLSRVHTASDTYRDLRREIFNAFRPVKGDGVSLRSQPWIYGDAFGTFPASDPENGLPLSAAAAARMQKWVDGDFEQDWGTVLSAAKTIADVPLDSQPSMLDRTPLHFCLADAFHPGCELTWPMRHASIWEKPFRIKALTSGQKQPDYGPTLTTSVALGPDGPLHAQSAGGLTRWMALPWQADTAGCRSGYEQTYDPYVPTFWPARVPNQVLTEESYLKIMDSSMSNEDRLAAFYERRSWYHPLSKYGNDDMTLMVDHFAELGVVERRAGPTDLPGVPELVYVETLPVLPAGLLLAAEAVVLPGVPVGPGTTPQDAEARKAGWQNEAQRQHFREARMNRRLATE